MTIAVDLGRKATNKQTIHNIKLIYRYISNNDHPVKTILTFCVVYHGNSPDIKDNPPYNFKHLIVGVSFQLHILMI